MTNAKCQLVQGWLAKVRRDLKSAHALARNTPPLLDTAIYHCLQAAEKAVKGYLAFCDEEIARVHDIGLLVRRAMVYEDEFEYWLDVGNALTPYARIYRYPGYADEPSQKQFDEALSKVEGLYGFVMSPLPLKMRI